MSFTVLCVWVRGHVPFGAEYVTRLRSMARRLLPTHRFVCLTDRPSLLSAGIEHLPARAPADAFAWWTKVQLFNPALPLHGRLVYFDLDVLLLRGLIDIVNFPAAFALAPDGANFQPRDGRRCVHRFNSSVMVWNHGEQAALYRDWSPGVAQRLWGDQDWIGERRPDAEAMPLAWFPRLSAIKDPPRWPEEARVLLCKKPKNAEAMKRFPWFDEAWQ